jgi:hypothetical protein
MEAAQALVGQVDVDLGQVRIPRKRNPDVAGRVTRLGQPVQLADQRFRRLLPELLRDRQVGVGFGVGQTGRG